MKLIISLIYLPILIGLNLSSTDNFAIENGKLLWQKVDETELTKKQLTQKIKSSGDFKNLELNENGIIADITNLTLDYKGYGSSEMSTPIYIARNNVNSFIQIQFKEGKYRVTIKNIKLTQSYDTDLSSQGEMTNLDVFALKKRNTEFKSSFLKKPSKIINFTFEKITEFKIKENDKW
jgi:hypothetical protein